MVPVNPSISWNMTGVNVGAKIMKSDENSSTVFSSV